MYIGRWQNWHKGHEWLINHQLEKGKNVWLAIRDVDVDENNPKEKPQAHSVYINALPNTYELDVDIMVEAKGKELAILPFIKTML